MKAAGKGLLRILGILIFVLPLILVLLVPSATRAQSECTDCKRTAYLNNVTTNTAEPDFRTMVKYRMWQALTSNCFHFLVEGNYIPQNYLSYCETEKRPPEYYFDVNYVENLPGPVLSRLSIDMYFVGPPQEKVISWVTEGDRPDQHFIQYHENKIFKMDFGLSDPRTSVLLRYRPIEEKVLKDFEKRPTQCLVKPAKRIVNPLEEIEVVISGIQDAKGERSREFNRLVVQAVEGKIIGGESLLVDRDLKAFKVGNSDVTFTYRAPAAPKTIEDTIYVYNACDILPEATVPMANTKMKDKIAEEKIEIREYDALLQVTKRETESSVTVFHSGSSDEVVDSNQRYDDIIEATVSLALTQDMALPNPVQNEILEYYHATSVKLERFQKLVHSEFHQNTHSKNCLTEETRTKKEMGQELGLQAPYTNVPSVVIIYVDAKTQKAKKVVIITLALKFQKTINEDFILKGCNTNTSNHKTHFENGFFSIEPVENLIPDPTFNPNGMADFLRELSKKTGSQQLPPIKGPKQEYIYPEFVVKSGDGKTSLGGEGRVLKEEHPENTKTRVERIYQWQMTKRKKSEA